MVAGNSIRVTITENDTDPQKPILGCFVGASSEIEAAATRMGLEVTDREASGEKVLYFAISSAHELRNLLGSLESRGINFARSISDTIHEAREKFSEKARGAGYDATDNLTVEYAGTEHGPYSRPEQNQMLQLQEAIGVSMNNILRKFKVGPDRYFGEFPYPDQETNAPQLDEVIGLRKKELRDKIVDYMQRQLGNSGIADVTISTEDKGSGYKHSFKVTAKGESITTNMKAYRAMADALKSIEG